MSRKLLLNQQQVDDINIKTTKGFFCLCCYILMTRNKIAKDLRTPKYRKRVIPDKKKKVKRFKLFELLERFR